MTYGGIFCNTSRLLQDIQPSFSGGFLTGNCQRIRRNGYYNGGEITAGTLSLTQDLVVCARQSLTPTSAAARASLLLAQLCMLLLVAGGYRG